MYHREKISIYTNPSKIIKKFNKIITNDASNRRQREIHRFVTKKDIDFQKSYTCLW